MNHDDLIEDDDGAILYFWLVYGVPEEATMAVLANEGWHARFRFEGVMEYLEAYEVRSRKSPSLLGNKRAGRPLSPATGYFLGYMAEELLSNYDPEKVLGNKWSASSLMTDLDKHLSELPERGLVTWHYQRNHYSICRDDSGYWVGQAESFVLDENGCWTQDSQCVHVGHNHPVCKDRSKLSCDHAAKAAKQMNVLVKHYNENKCDNVNQAKLRGYKPPLSMENKPRYEK